MITTKKSQVWVETAIYTLIGLAIIAIILSAALPQIDKARDRGIVTQTMDALDVLNNKISQVEQSPGSVGIVDFTLGKGRLEINSANDTLVYILENTRFKLSEPGEEITEGRLLIKTLEYGSRFNIFLKVDYADRINITYSDDDNRNMVLHPGTTPYRIQVENIGDNLPDEKTHIDIDVL
jgi:type II secretory pathway pseudopilin PulG